ncbi:MAG: hypothetical protein GY820_41020 [Gammaproteobacteria bacterium]|nr:hypothetical protein [Gammaproteobacteria bacterium]
MATWVDPVDSQTDPDAPLTSELGKRWDNNVIAAFEGAADAPRLSLASIERVAAGDTVRSSRVLNGFNNLNHIFSFMQAGTVRASGTSSGGGDWGIDRSRNGVTTTIAGGTASSFSYDIDVLPFDTFDISWSKASPSNYVIEISTDGGNLWCGNPSVDVGVTGNVNT